MAYVKILWDQADVAPGESAYDLEVPFASPAPENWWGAFGSAIEDLLRETYGGRWSSIDKVGEQAEGVQITGLQRDSASALRMLLDSAADIANRKIEQDDARRQHDEATVDEAHSVAEELRADVTA